MKVNIYRKTNLHSWVFPSFNAMKVNICLKANLHSWIVFFLQTLLQNLQKEETAPMLKIC